MDRPTDYWDTPVPSVVRHQESLRSVWPDARRVSVDLGRPRPRSLPIPVVPSRTLLWTGGSTRDSHGPRGFRVSSGLRSVVRLGSRVVDRIGFDEVRGTDYTAPTVRLEDFRRPSTYTDNGVVGTPSGTPWETPVGGVGDECPSETHCGGRPASSPPCRRSPQGWYADFRIFDFSYVKQVLESLYRHFSLVALPPAATLPCTTQVPNSLWIRPTFPHPLDFLSTTGLVRRGSVVKPRNRTLVTLGVYPFPHYTRLNCATGTGRGRRAPVIRLCLHGST